MNINVSALTSHFPNPQDGFTTTASGSVSSGATTVPLSSTGDYSNGDVVVFIIDPADTDKKQVFVGIVDISGSQLTGVKWVGGTNQAHSSGATIVDYYDAAHVKMVTKGLLVSLDQDGTLKNGAVDNVDALANNVVETAKVKDSAITTTKVADAAITTAKLDTAAVTPEKMLGIDLLGRTTAITGSAPTAGTGQFYIQAGSSVGVFSSNALDISFPTPFPNGVLSVVVTDGDNSAGGGLSVTQANINASSFRAQSPSDGTKRVNWIAIGF